MQKIILLILLLVFYQKSSLSQYIFEEEFNSTIPNMVYSTPPGILFDTNWYSYDGDTLLDGSGAARPPAWYRTLAFAPIDGISGTDTNYVMASNSNFIIPGKAKNWLITPAIYIESGQGYLRWASAPLSTPYKLDRFRVMASTTTNDTSSFTTTLFKTAEYAGPSNMGGNFNLYNFNPSTLWIHGWDGFSIQNTQVEFTGDSSKWVGVLTEKAYACLPYSNQFIYLAFVHDSFDDNLISIDNISIWGACVEVSENKIDLDFKIAPNPFTNFLSINSAIAIDKIKIFDISGRIQLLQNASSNNVSLDLTFLSPAPYFIEIISSEIRKTYKIIKTE